jgi:hypothetical protein
MTLRSRLVDGPASFGARARARRRELLQRLFPELPSYRVLDLGGTAESWLRAEVSPKAVTVLNLHATEPLAERSRDELPKWIELVTGDACAPPAAVLDGAYDLVFSNSLIEHVGGAARRAMLAEVVREAAPRYWVQTPYRYFPVEPHYLFPGYQFLPVPARARLARSWPLIHTRDTTWAGGVGTALEVELLGATEMRYLFPDSTLHRERLAGLTKSLVAVKN